MEGHPPQKKRSWGYSQHEHNCLNSFNMLCPAWQTAPCLKTLSCPSHLVSHKKKWRNRLRCQPNHPCQDKRQKAKTVAPEPIPYEWAPALIKNISWQDSKENFCIRQVSLDGIFYQCLQRTGAACYGSPPAPYAADLAGLTLSCQLRTDLLTFLKPVAYL